MTWISTQFSRHWRNIHLGAVLVMSAVLIFWPPAVKHVAAPAVYAFYYPFDKLQQTLELWQSRAEANDELRASLMKTSLELQMYREAVRENQRLRDALGFEPPSGYRLLPTEVVKVSGYDMPVQAVIDRGEADSVYVNQPVVNQEGLIGRVTFVAPDHAAVQLLTDPANRVAARVAESREMGIVRYVSGEGMILDNFPIHGYIVTGDTVISSGLGGVYPPGLRVGIVTDVQREEHQPFARVSLRAAANFHSIEELFLLSTDDRR